ncbi:MAG: hypothetical protein WAK90_05605 [Pseudolabrys sp.]
MEEPLIRHTTLLLGVLISGIAISAAEAKPKFARQQIPIIFDANGTVVGNRPAGCPRAFCGCEASLYLFGQIRTDLNRASNWMRFPRTSPAPNTVAVRNHHVMVLVSQVDGSNWLVHDGNSGGGLTRNHVVSICGYRIVNPRG